MQRESESPMDADRKQCSASRNSSPPSHFHSSMPLRYSSGSQASSGLPAVAHSILNAPQTALLSAPSVRDIPTPIQKGGPTAKRCRLVTIWPGSPVPTSLVYPSPPAALSDKVLPSAQHDQHPVKTCISDASPSGSLRCERKRH